MNTVLAHAEMLFLGVSYAVSRAVAMSYRSYHSQENVLGADSSLEAAGSAVNCTTTKAGLGYQKKDKAKFHWSLLEIPIKLACNETTR